MQRQGVKDRGGYPAVGVRRDMGPKPGIGGSWCGFGDRLPTMDSADGVPRRFWVWRMETTPVGRGHLGRPCRPADD
jgi:hypothetical protein